MKNKNGITLIALVITIIVLLILAGVSIAMLAGQNGILTQAQSAKEETEQNVANEKVNLSVIGAISQTEDGKLTIENLKIELEKYDGVIEGEKFPIMSIVDGKKFKIYGNGKVIPIEHETLTSISGYETKNTIVQDNFGNQIVIPAGFKVENPNDNVTNGIVIEDVTHDATVGSQFVWIPVGEVIKDNDGNTEIVTLSRYTFANDSEGTPTDKVSIAITNSYENSYSHIEINTSTYGNATAKENIESEESGFRKSAKDNHGYYIGRYEARKEGTQLTVKASDKVYNNITQPNAATASRGMYADSNFESDLINSYAWDTAIVFLQKFDNRENKETLKPYSRQISLNDSNDGLANQGTNNLELNKQDVICNVWDMASNCREWTTETSNNSRLPCTSRGGYCRDSSYYASYRVLNSTGGYSDSMSFRLLLYL